MTYNVVIDVNNPEQKLKPGMTANLTVTIDERNNVLKVPNAALRFTPQDANGQRLGRSGEQLVRRSTGRVRNNRPAQQVAVSVNPDSQTRMARSRDKAISRRRLRRCWKARRESFGCWARTASRKRDESRLV